MQGLAEQGERRDEDEDEWRGHPACERRGEEGADLRSVGGDGKIQVARAQDDFVAAGFHGGVGTDAERGEGGPRGFTRPLVQGLAEQGERGDEDEDAPRGHAFGDP